MRVAKLNGSLGCAAKPAMPMQYQMIKPWTVAFATLLAIFSSGAALLAQGMNSAKAAAGGGLLNVPPRSWIVDASANELVALYHKGSYLRYRMHSVDEKGDRVRDVIESKDGSVARLVLKDGRAAH